MSRTGARVLLACAVLVAAALGSIAVAQDAPHDATNNITCTTCHRGHGASYPALVDRLCQGCHVDGGPARAQATHSSRTTDSSYGNWEVDCWACHDPHSQDQPYGAFVTDRLRAVIKIIDPSCSTTFCAALSVDRVVRSDQVEYASQGAGVDGDAQSTDDLCQACHEQTRNYNPNTAFNVHTDFGPDSQPGGNCTTCHEHREGYAAGGCVDCHATPQPAALAYRRQVTRVGGDFERPSHHVADGSGLEIVTDADCRVCHDPSSHPLAADPAVSLRNPEGGPGYSYSGTGGSIEGFCLGCHDADGGPAFPSDGRTPPDIETGWAGATHSVSAELDQDACLDCHGGSDPTRAAASVDRNAHGSSFRDLLSRRVRGTTVANSEEALCFACHDGSPASNIAGQFSKGVAPSGPTSPIYRHPVVDAEQVTGPGRTVECSDCHDPHQARSTNANYGVAGIAINGTPIAVGGDVAEHEVCFRCHGDTYNAARSRATNRRLDFQPTNSSYHPVVAAGRNRSQAMANQLQFAGLTRDSLVTCSDCHNNEQTANANGWASNSTASPQGPHGSQNAFLLRAFYFSNPAGPSSWNPSNFALCFLCHDSRVWSTESNQFTNFDDRGDNLHWYHVNAKADDRITCANCHYNTHSNQNAGWTNYLINGVMYNTPPSGFRTRGVVFSPDVQPTGTRTEPTWVLETSTRRRYCFVRCHGKTHDAGEDYTPDSAGDNDSLTIP